MLPHWTENDVIIDGATFHYYRTGSGGKPALVLAHGFSDNGLNWLPVACDLEDEYDVIMPDARGHGKSQRVQPGEVVDHARDLAGVIQALKLNRPVVGGHSMGGSTAAELGARYAHLARALILEDPGWHDEPRTFDARSLETNPWFAWLKSVPAMTLEEVMAKGRADNPTWPEIEMRPWAEAKQQLDLNLFHIKQNRQPWREAARALVCPTLLITAEVEKGALVTEAMASDAWALNNYIQIAPVSNAGHCIRRENYGQYIKVVREFLGEVK